MLGFQTQAAASSKLDRRSAALPDVESLLASLDQQGLEPRLVTSLLARLRHSDGLKLLSALEERQEANIYHYNSLLNSFSKDSSWSLALAFLEKMSRRKVQKDTISVNAAIRACALAECWQKSLELLQVMQQEMLRSDTISFNSAISGMSGLQWPLALQLFEDMERLTVVASTVTFNSILATSAEEMNIAKLQGLLQRMSLMQLQKDVITYSSAIHACGADWERAISFLQQMRDEEIQINLIARNAVIDICDKGNAWQVAIQLLRGADTIGFNSAINACAVEWTVAIQLIEQMQNQELQLDVITFNAAIGACDEARNWKKSFELFQELQGRRLVPNTRSYAAVIHCCEMEGLWPEALRFLEEMERGGVELNTMTYNSAINACEKASEWTLALHLFTSLESSFLAPTVVSFGACAKALEQGGRWMEVLDLLVLMMLTSHPPDVVSSSAAITACAKEHVWLEALDILEDMLDFQLDIPSIAVSATYSACERRSVPAGARTRHFGGVKKRRQALQGFEQFDSRPKLPSPEAMMRALEMLHFLGAIDDEGDLTDVGSRMADFPVDPHLSRTIIASSERSCLSEVLAVIAMLSVPPPFSRPRYAQKAADKAHKHFASGYGDHLSLLNAYQAYVGASSKADFCREHFLSDRNMKQAENVRRQLAGIARKTQLADETSDMLTVSIRKAFVEGFFMQCAHLDESGKHYMTVRDQQMVAIHPSSFLQHKPEWVLYHETVVTDRCYMRNATAIPPEMLIEVSPKFYHPDRCKLHDHAKKMLRRALPRAKSTK